MNKAVSFNQPNLSSTAVWSPNGITFANQSIVGTSPTAIFIDTNNTIYTINQEEKQILIWNNNTLTPTNITLYNFSNPWCLFVTTNGDIYIGDGDRNKTVEKWRSDTKTFHIVMEASSGCVSLFIDINDNLYCSMLRAHQVVKRELNSSSITPIRVAGTGLFGSTSNELAGPSGIFVDVNLNLFVADFGNHRIQLFPLGEMNAITVAGEGSKKSTILLKSPTGILLDANKYLFIADQDNHRIVGEGPYGFRCLVGCYGAGFQSNQLSYPSTMSFDIFGNMFVVDERNHRIQKFDLITKYFALSFNQPPICQSPTWDPYAITFANQSIVGLYPPAIFIDTNNTIYTINQEKKQILIWNDNILTPTNITLYNFSAFWSLFVTTNGDIYIDDGHGNKVVKKWRSDTKTFHIVMEASSGCAGLFIDINDNLYCSMRNADQVVKMDLNSSSITPIRVAGTDRFGSASNELFRPIGIFVDVNLDLLVADSENHRIQLFPLGEMNAITVAGEGSKKSTILLKSPTGILLDANKYLFIVDSFNHRIVGEGPYGFRCLVGCYGTGFQSNQLNSPSTISFDIFGNMFVVDAQNHRIQKFDFEKSCDIPFNQPKFCSKPVWNRNGITFANQLTLGLNPSTIFINGKDSIYSINRDKKQILVWNENDVNSLMIVPTNFHNSSSLFVTSIGNIYIDNGMEGQVKQWINNTNIFFDAMHVFSSCFSLFIDVKYYLYCSMSKHHQVIKKKVLEFTTISDLVAGTGSKGSGSTELDHPHGIFVDTKFDTYVADCGNNRIQKFLSGKIDGIIGITEVGSKAAVNRFPLSCPTAITLDAQRFLFIVDSNNHRIVQAGSNDIRCVIGCNGITIKSTQLLSPSDLAFDSFGNLFVVDSGNHRIQIFEYSKQSCNMSSVIQWTNSLTLTKDSQMYSQDCNKESYYYQSFVITVPESRSCSIWSNADIDTSGFIYEKNFDPLNPNENLLEKDDDSGSNEQFKFELPLYDDTTYILVVTTSYSMIMGGINITIMGPKNMTINRLSTLVNIQSNYSSELTTNSPKYCRDYKTPDYYYETSEINVMKTDSYIIWSKSEMDTYGYLYKNNFDPLQPFGNLIKQHSGKCNQNQLKFYIDLEQNTKYILVVTTYYSNVTGNFTIYISGNNSVTIDHSLDSKQRSCSIGDRCHFYSTTIGLPLDDILRGEIQPNVILVDQSYSIQTSAALTTFMFIGGLINSIFSYLTFNNKEVQQVGCGLYLFASSITSLLTICMFFINFWFSVLTQINVSTSFSILRGGCIIIEPILKLFLYCDTWLNACVAIERAIQVLKGIHFNKKKSKSVARWIIFILPLCIMASLIHEPLHREMFEYETETDKDYVNNTESITIEEVEAKENKTLVNTLYKSTINRHVWCVIRYSSSSIQTYNTIILFFHLLIPFIANLFSALFIIFGSARQRSAAQTNQTYKEHVRHQFNEHKQLIISPIALLILTMPRLIISILPGCIRTSQNLWLYLTAYFFSFAPSILIFIIFVVPSNIYMKSFKNSLTTCRRHTHQ